MTGSSLGTRPASRVTIDRMLAVITLVAIALVVGSLLPSQRSGIDDGMPVGLLRLSGSDRLVAFEDYTYGPGAWQNAEVDRSRSGPGAVLRPNGAALSRRIELPDDTDHVDLSFDIVGLGQSDQLDVDIDSGPVTFDARTIEPNRIRYSARIARPGPAVTLSLRVEEDLDWALDNLMIIARVAARAAPASP